MSPINCPRLGGLNDTRTSATANALADLDIIFIGVSCFSLVASLHSITSFQTFQSQQQQQQ